MKAAIVGCGGIGRAHAVAYGQLSGVELVFAVDRDASRAQALADEFKAVPLNDLADLPEDVEVVSVTTDPASHAPVAVSLLQRGYAVFCEKPLGMTPAESRRLLEAASAAGRPLSVGFKMRYEPCFQMARELVEQVGPIVQIATTKMQPFEPRGQADWRPRVGAMIELSVHDFDLISFITGLQPRCVLAAYLSQRLAWEREDGFTALVDYDDDVRATLSGCYTTDSKWHGADFSLTITGERGYLRVLRGDRVILHTDEYQSFTPEAPGNTFVMELQGFADAIRQNVPPPIAPEAGFTATALIEAIWQSGQEHKPVEVERP
ncbi:MAG: Gfo/Idh/MocA family protein [Armatimonadota bacterium]